MSLNLYDITVPTLRRALEQLIKVLKAGEKWAEENNVDKQKILDGKLAEDMLPLTFQVQTACNTSKMALSRIGGQELPAVPDNEKTLPELYARIEQTIDFLKAAEREKFFAPEDRVVMKLPSTELKFTAIGYVQKHVLPNFFFHHTTAYLILRNMGAPVGKMLFLGASDIQDL